MNPPDVKRRRSLTHVGGPVVTSGDRELANLLARALDVQPAHAPAPTDAGGDDADRVHVHGFHSYPARIHPTTAASLVRAVSREGATVLDPFCGSGTVVVEAMLAKRHAIGADLNPLAVRLTRLKTALPGAPARAAIASTAEAVGAFATDRRKRRAGATRRYPPEDVELFDPHVLLELDSLQAGIASQSGLEPLVRDALELVLSAILIKVSRRASDTSTAMAPRRLAAGFATRIFVSKAAELARRLDELALQVPADAPKARVELDDAAKLRTLSASTVDAVVTSPPYVSTYDYFAQHAARLRWLKLDATRFAASEMGARRRFGRLDAGAARIEWSRELVAVLRSFRRVCRTNARVVMVLADSAVQDEALRADTILAAAARETGFLVLARAAGPPAFSRRHRTCVSEPAPLGARDSAREAVEKAAVALVIFEPLDGEPQVSVEVPSAARLVDICDEECAPVPFSCRSACCGTCRVLVLEGSELLEPAAEDELEILDVFGDDPASVRLACQARLRSGIGRLRIRPAP